MDNSTTSPAHTSDPWFIDQATDTTFKIGPQRGGYHTFAPIVEVIGASTEDSLANARLIAAAPSMLTDGQALNVRG